MADITFDIEKRDETMNPRQLRASGKLPGTVYGKGVESVSIQLDRHSFSLEYRKNKDAQFELKLDKKKYNVKVQELQMNYSTNEALNVEFKTV